MYKFFKQNGLHQETCLMTGGGVRVSTTFLVAHTHKRLYMVIKPEPTDRVWRHTNTPHTRGKEKTGAAFQ